MNNFMIFSRRDAEAQREDLMNHEGTKEEEKNRRTEEQKRNTIFVWWAMPTLQVIERIGSKTGLHPATLTPFKVKSFWSGV
jgi:hypothetical protein